jgi:hypothetical protein
VAKLPAKAEDFLAQLPQYEQHLPLNLQRQISNRI